LQKFTKRNTEHCVPGGAKPAGLAGSFEAKTEKGENQKKIILYQGAVNIGRGLEQAILAMHFIETAKLIIAGDGDILIKLQNLVINEKLQNKVEFTGRLPLKELTKLTPQADLGLSIEEDLGLNYRFALPNKLFDYIQAQVPVLITNLPEMAAIVNQYNIGENHQLAGTAASGRKNYGFTK
jgi:glycosyltransferase involved in cell wall biosynthesis